MTAPSDGQKILQAGEDIQAPCFVYIGKDGKAYMARPEQEPLRREPPPPGDPRVRDPAGHDRPEHEGGPMNRRSVLALLASVVTAGLSGLLARWRSPASADTGIREPQWVTITGRDASGAITTERINLDAPPRVRQNA